jgi:hypothetical protein
MSDVQHGWPVFTRDGENLGKVRDVRGNCFKVDAPMEPDYWLRRDCVSSTSNQRVTTSFEKSRVDDYKLDDDEVMRTERPRSQGGYQWQGPLDPESQYAGARRATQESYPGYERYDQESGFGQRSGTREYPRPSEGARYGEASSFLGTREWEQDRPGWRQEQDYPGAYGRMGERSGSGSYGQERGYRGGEGWRGEGGSYGGESWRGRREGYGAGYGEMSEGWRGEGGGYGRMGEGWRGEGSYGRGGESWRGERGYGGGSWGEGGYRGESGYGRGSESWRGEGGYSSEGGYRGGQGAYQSGSTMTHGGYESDQYDWRRGQDEDASWKYQGPESGRGPKSYQRPDDRICEEVCERMTRHGSLDASDIDVEVHGAEVVLKGEVPDRRQKRLAEDMADGVYGVKNVRNELRTKDQPGRTTTTRKDPFQPEQSKVASEH